MALGREKIRAFVDKELDPQDGLRRFGEVDAGLATAAAWLRDIEESSEGNPLDDGAPRVALEGRSSADTQRESHDARVDLERAIEARPSVAGSVGLAALVALVTVPSVVALLHLGEPSSTAWNSWSGTQLANWVLCFLLVGLVLGFWVVFRLASGSSRLRKAVHAASRSREEASHGRPILPAGPAGRAVGLRRRRTAGLLADLIGDERRRLQGLRTSIAETVRRTEMELTNVGFQRAKSGGVGDPAGVLGDETPLHVHLIDPASLEELWRKSRATTDDERWAVQLLQSAWPEDGLAHDLPFDPDGSWDAQARTGQHGILLSTSVFSWPGSDREVSDRLARFLQQAPSALGLGADPHDEHGNPLPTNVIQNLLVVAPQEGRDLVRVAEKKSGARLQTRFGVAPTSHVVILRTHAGFTTRQLWKGIERRSAR